MSSAIESIIAERNTQLAKGWDAEHDDDHGPEHLRRLAKSYVDVAQGDSPWDRKNRRARMVKAAALLVAAIEVLDRHDLQQTWPKPAPERTDVRP